MHIFNQKKLELHLAACCRRTIWRPGLPCLLATLALTCAAGAQGELCSVDSAAVPAAGCDKLRLGRCINDYEIGGFVVCPVVH
jgi:hypothetical protein